MHSGIDSATLSDQHLTRHSAQVREKVKRIEFENAALKERIARLIEMTQHRGVELKSRAHDLAMIQREAEPKSPKINQEAERIDRENERDLLMEDLIKGRLYDNILKFKRDADNLRKELQFASDSKPNSFVHTVKVTWCNTTGSDPQPMNTRVATFRIASFTTLTELKNEACKFWGLNATEMRLRWKTKEIAEHDQELKVEQFIVKSSLAPELLLYSASFAGSTLSQAQDCKMQVVMQSQLEDLDKHERIDSTLDNFLGLKRYMPVPVFHSSTDRIVSVKSRDSSFCTLLFLILVGFLSLYIIIIRRNLTMDYWQQQEVRNALERNLNLSTKNYYKLVYVNDVYDYLKQVVAPTFFQTSLNSTTSSGLDFIGPVRLRQMRSKTTDCALKDELDLGDYRCHYATYSGDKRSTSDIDDGNNLWEGYKSANDNDIDSEISGYLSDYDGSGFVYDAKPSTTTQADFITAVQTLQDNQWIDFNTRALAISANIYIRSADVWLTILILHEFHVAGVIVPSKLMVSTFLPNMFERANEKSAEAADICRLLFVLYFFYMYIVTVIEVKYDGTRNYGHAISFIGLVDLLMILSVVTAFGYSHTVIADSKDIYNSNDFTDMLDLNSHYSFSYTWNALAFFFTCLRTLLLLRLNSRMMMIVNVVQIAAASVLSFMIIFVPLLLGFCVCAMQTWGSTSFYYYQLDVALVSILVLTIGHVDYEFMLRINEGWTIFFLIVYFFVMSFFLFGAFMGIYMDTYRLIRLRDGYVDDQSNWSKVQFFEWLMAWMPRKITAAIERIKHKAAGA